MLKQWTEPSKNKGLSKPSDTSIAICKRMNKLKLIMEYTILDIPYTSDFS